MKHVLVVFAGYGEAHMGARRVRRIVRHLPASGWAPTVLTDGAPPAAAESEFPQAVVVRADAPDLAGLYRRWCRPRPAASAAPVLEARDIGLTTWINRWILIPDKYVVWRRAALRKGRELLGSGEFDLIFASHQPATNLLAAARLAQESGVPLYAEYRDLWTRSPYVHFQGATPAHDRIHRWLERRILRRATVVSCVARGIADSLRDRYGNVLRCPPELHYNFFDEAEYPAVPAKPAGAFVVSYVGSMYLSREPSIWLEGFRQFIDRRALPPARIRFRWLGALSGIPGLGGRVRGMGLEPYIDYLGQVSHTRALAELMNCHVALHIQAPNDTVHVPGKFFEALGARTPLLAISPPCELTDLIARTHGGLFCGHTPAAVADTLDVFWRHFAGGTAWPFDEDARRVFSAQAAVADLCRGFDRIARP